MTRVPTPDHIPTAGLRGACALLRLRALDDVEGVALYLTGTVTEPLTARALLAGLVNVTARLADDTGTDLTEWVSNLLVELSTEDG